MSDTANVALGAYQRFFVGSPAAAESGPSDTTSVHVSHGEPIPHSLVGELEELHRLEGMVSSDDFSANLKKLIQLLQSATPLNEAGSWSVRAGHGRVAMHYGSVSHWSGKVDLGAVEYGHLSNTSPFPSGSISRHALLHSGTGTAKLLPHDDQDLHAALSDLDLLNDEAKEDDLPEPDAEAVANARTLLPRLYAILPVRYRVSPTERRGVAIDAPMKRGTSVAVECAPDDTVYCFATINGNSRRAKFYQMDGLPDVFIEKALRDLDAG